MPRPITVGGTPRVSSGAPPLPFPSATNPPAWYTVPNLNAPIMEPSNGTMGLPWNNFLYFNASRAALLAQLQNDVISINQQLTVINGQITTLQGQVSTLQTQLGTANANIATLQGQVNTINNSTIPALQAEDANLQSQITNNNNNLQGQVNAITDRLNRAGIPP